MTFLPIVDRELRIAARRPATYWMRFFSALAATVLMLICVVGMGAHQTPVSVAKETFEVLSGILMVFCLFSGMFQTADCLSSEKRDGTLGLLFLTDLQGYDVILGKLASSSLSGVYGLMSALPVLAIPLLGGGVTGGEFWRVVVVLLVGLFLSLGVGILVSAVTRESRQALGLTAFAIIFLTALLPAIQGLFNLLNRTSYRSHSLEWPSLGYALSRSADVLYKYRKGPVEFWGSILTIVAIGLGCLLLASFILPRAWQEKSQSASTAEGGSRWRRLRYGTSRRRGVIRDLLAANPFHWLAIRDRVSQISFWLVAGVLGPFWLVCFYVWEITSPKGFARMAPFEFLVFVTFGLSLSFKVLVALEASRRLSDDRKSGALELLLVTPLAVDKIIAGQRRALRNQFGIPLLLIALLFVVMFALSRHLNFGNDHIYEFMMIGNVVVLFADFLALGWAGMWTGLRARNHNRAVLFTLLQVLVVPWLFYFLLGMAGFFQSSGGFMAFLVLWFSLGVVNDVVWAAVARRGLTNEFRQQASGVAIKRPGLAPIAATEYTNA